VIWARLALFGFALAAFPAFAQGSGEVRGSVVDAQGGEALSNVAIVFTGTAYRATTDAAGRFRFAAVEPGDYTLTASTVGYRMIKRPFHLDAGETKEFEIVLSAGTFRQTDSVVVQGGGPFEIARQDSLSTLALAGNDAKNLGSVLADDPLRAVQSLPGVSSNDDFEARFSLRGADFSRIGLHFDGVLLHMPFHTIEGSQQTGSGSAFNGDMVEELELHESAWPARFQDRTAGVLDIHSRDGSRTGNLFRVTASASNAGVLAEGPLGRRGSWMASARKSYLQYILERTMSDMPLVFGLEDAQGRLTYDVNPRNTLYLDVMESYSDIDRARDKDRLGINSLMTGAYNYTFAHLTWRYTPTSALMLTNHAAWMREKYDNANRAGQSLAGGYYGEWVWDAAATWSRSLGGSLDFGWSVRRARDNSFFNQLLTTAPYVRLMDHGDGTGVVTGGYAQQSWTLAGGHAHISAGARWDRNSADGIAVVSPNASLAFTITPSTRVQLAWGQYAQFPELADLKSPYGGRRLLPIRATHAVGSIERRFGERTRVRAEYFEREDRDLIDRPWYEPRMLNGVVFVPPVNPPLYNSGRGYARGYEFIAERRSANRLTGWVSYAYCMARQRDGIERISYPTAYDQRHTVNAFGSYRVSPSVNLSAKWAYGSNYPYPGFLRIQNGVYYLTSARNQLRFDPFQRLDVRINKSWTQNRYKMTLYGEVVNVTNRRNYRFDSLNSYNTKTGQIGITLDRLFPILPSAGIVFEW
jgi:hypothetical protein